MPSQELIDEKFGDSNNYMILLEAVFVDEKGLKETLPTAGEVVHTGKGEV